MKFNFIILNYVLMALFVAKLNTCKKNKPINNIVNNSSTESVNNPINNIIGKKSSVVLNSCSPKDQVYICFNKIITDSRCPIGVNCFWQGYAAIETTFYENGNSHTFKMCLPKNKNSGMVNDTLINGYKIIFKDLIPYPNNTIAKPLPTPNAIFEITN